MNSIVLFRVLVLYRCSRLGFSALYLWCNYFCIFLNLILSLMYLFYCESLVSSSVIHKSVANIPLVRYNFLTIKYCSWISIMFCFLYLPHLIYGKRFFRTSFFPVIEEKSWTIKFEFCCWMLYKHWIWAVVCCYLTFDNNKRTALTWHLCVSIPGTCGKLYLIYPQFEGPKLYYPSSAKPDASFL